MNYVSIRALDLGVQKLMQALRRRIPFAVEDGSGDDPRVLDEQEQDELIHQLRTRAHRTNTHYIFAAYLLLSLSTIAHLINAFTRSPPALLTFLSLVAHLNLFLYIFPSRIRSGRNEFHLPSPLPFGFTYSLSAVAPTLSLFIGHSWKTVVWWCITPAMVYTIQVVKMSVYEINESISTLERLKYRSPGA